MSHSGSKTVIIAAVVGNLAIAVTKFIATAITGSSAMFSEGIHSLVDTGNGLLLLFGIKQSLIPPDENHPFGRGQELYFWTLIVAIMIFAVGGGISFYKGILHVIHPEAIEDVLVNFNVLGLSISLKKITINYLVLGFSIFFESISWTVALLEFNRQKGKMDYIRAMQSSKSPVTFAVFFEDSAALAGLGVALIGIWLGHILHMPVLDGVASMVIGLILGGVAIFLLYETKGLLIGESANPKVIANVRNIALSDPDVKKFVRARTMHLGPDEILLAMDLLFNPDMHVDQLAKVIDRLEVQIRDIYPEIKFIYLEAKGVSKVSTLPEK